MQAPGHQRVDGLVEVAIGEPGEQVDEAGVGLDGLSGETAEEGVHQRAGQVLTDRAAMVGAGASDRVLDLVEGRDAQERLIDDGQLRPLPARQRDQPHNPRRYAVTRPRHA